MKKSVVVRKEVLLVGGGHSHVEVVRQWGMKPIEGVRMTLVSKESQAPYSGMLPGLIAGHHSHSDAHIDLRALCIRNGVAFVMSSVDGVDPHEHSVQLIGRPSLSYDVLSINVGSTPSDGGVEGVKEFAVPVKPVSVFLGRMDRWMNEWERAEEVVAVTVVGGGAGSVELILSLAYRFRTLELKIPKLRLITRDSVIMRTHAKGVQKQLMNACQQAGIEIVTESEIVEVTAKGVVTKEGRVFDSSKVIWATHASAAGWFEQSGLTTDESGFLSVELSLEVQNFQNVFAAGDCATIKDDPKPKSGVFAVRQGPVLAENIRRRLLNQPLLTLSFQKHFLSLMGTGDKYAVASRGALSASGEWVWKWKRWIDLKWMGRYRAPWKEMRQNSLKLPGQAAYETAPCRGCGSKAPSDVLMSVLSSLERAERPELMVRADPEDAVVIKPPKDVVEVQTVDFLNQMISDPYLFGRIAAEHALNDVLAMGAEPAIALSQVVVPYSEGRALREYLFQVLSGAAQVLYQHGCSFAGGHSSQGSDSGLGLSITGWMKQNDCWRKSGLRSGDRLILSKPLGVGVVLAGEMHHKAKAVWVDEAIALMLQSHRGVVEQLKPFKIHACTDVSGFGLAGHIVEMAEASNARVTLDLDCVPVLDGARKLERLGVRSSLFDGNFRSFSHSPRLSVDAKHPVAPLLFDPQTSGGLLLSVAKEAEKEVLNLLKKSGFENASCIGVVE